MKTTYTITEAEKQLLEAAKRTCSLFGHDSRGIITANDEKSRQVAENVLLEQLKLGKIKIDGIEVKDFTNEDSPHAKV